MVSWFSGGDVVAIVIALASFTYIAAAVRIGWRARNRFAFPRHEQDFSRLYAGLNEGAIHPGAEGRAATADAVLPELAVALGLPAP